MKNRIAQLRKENGYTLKQLAGILGINDNTLSHYETFKRKPSIEMYYHISEIFNVSFDYLVGKTNIKSSNLEELEKLMNEFVNTEIEMEFQAAITQCNTVSELLNWNTKHIDAKEVVISTSLTNLIRSGFRRKVSRYIDQITI